MHACMLEIGFHFWPFWPMLLDLLKLDFIFLNIYFSVTAQVCRYIVANCNTDFFDDRDRFKEKNKRDIPAALLIA